MKTDEKIEPDTRSISPQEHGDPLITDAAWAPEGGDVFRRHEGTWIAAIDDWTIWLDARSFSEGTIYQARWRIRDLYKHYADRSPWKLITADLLRWYTRPEWSPGMRNNARSSLRSFYSWAVGDGRTKRNPADRLPAIRATQGLPRPVSEPVVQRVMAESDDRTRLMVALAAYAGLRDAEIAGLQWSDITDSQLIIKGKGRKTRTIWVHEILAAELDAEKARRGAGKTGTGYRYMRDIDVFVFPSQNGGHMKPNRVSHILSKALGDDGTGHGLRHRFATEVFNATGDLAAVQDLLGHASPATTRIYTKVADRRLRDAVNSIK